MYVATRERTWPFVVAARFVGVELKTGMCGGDGCERDGRDGPARVCRDGEGRARNGPCHPLGSAYGDVHMEYVMLCPTNLGGLEEQRGGLGAREFTA